MTTRVHRRKGEEGFILVLSLLLLLVVTLIGFSAMSTTTQEILMSGNKRISEKVFYVAEAGINELVGRFRAGAIGEISDNDQTNPNWKLFLAMSSQRATGIGYNTTDPTHHWVQSLQSQLDFAVEIRHKVDASNSVIMQEGVPVYSAMSHGYTVEGGKKVLEVEINKGPNFDVPAALYSKAPVEIKGSSTYISGMDKCPLEGAPQNKAGIITTTPTITESGIPTIEGDPPTSTSSSMDLPLSEMVNWLKDGARFGYDYSADVTLTGYSDSWGTPTANGTEQPLSYSGTMNIVYFNMNGDKTLKLAGGSHGAGILLVNGNLEVSGGFSWYGEIIVTGACNFTGGGEKNITGAVLAGESATVATDVGGNVGILYCSDAVKKLKGSLPPYKITSWREVF